MGNRKDTLVTGGGLDPGNRLRRWGPYRMDYDAAGSLVAKRTLKATDTTQVVRRDSLFWSALGLLDSVRTRDSLNTLTRVGFGYDASGRRIRKSTASGTSRYLWDGDALVMELDSLGNRKAEYTYYPGADNPESVRRHDRGDTTYYYHQDGARNVVALLKKTGTTNAIAAQYDSLDPFGNGQTSGGSVPNPLQFAGREYDAETGLNYLRARYYDPAVGRFVSEDPAGLSGGINQYAYASNDPGNRRDPSGLLVTGDPDGMDRRTWMLAKERGPADWAVNWGALLDLHGMLDDIAMVGVPDRNIDVICDAMGCRRGSRLASSSMEVAGVGPCKLPRYIAMLCFLQQVPDATRGLKPGELPSDLPAKVGEPFAPETLEEWIRRLMTPGWIIPIFIMPANGTCSWTPKGLPCNEA